MFDTPSSPGAELANCARREPTVRQRLTEKKEGLENELSKVNDALRALDDNPELERVLTTVGQAIRY